jgi:hypothetical protein
MSRAIARAYVFSGRPDPTWEVGEDLVERLEGIWRTLSEFHGSAPSPPPLGYRGCALKHSDVEYVAYGGVVSKYGRLGRLDREDVSRRFERLLLASAPAGSFPEDLLPPPD